MKNKEEYKQIIKRIYSILLKTYGYQGWWPLKEIALTQPKSRGYHPRDYTLPKTKLQRYEVIVGAILTQSTSWKQVEKSINNLWNERLLDPTKILTTYEETIKEMIKPSGYFNQKYKKLINITKWFLENDEKFLNANTIEKLRKELLSIWGIGKETADSILLYAYKKPIFVVDAYTKRLFTRLGFEFKSYDELQEMFHNSLEKDFKIFQEYHALIVEHSKRHCKSKPNCKDCSLSTLCKINKFNKNQQKM